MVEKSVAPVIMPLDLYSEGTLWKPLWDAIYSVESFYGFLSPYRHIMGYYCNAVMTISFYLI
jgi:hypothetical protein